MVRPADGPEHKIQPLTRNLTVNPVLGLDRNIQQLQLVVNYQLPLPEQLSPGPAHLLAGDKPGVVLVHLLDHQLVWGKEAEAGGFRENWKMFFNE